MARWWMRPAFHFSLLVNVVMLTVLLFALSAPRPGYSLVGY